MAPGVIADLPEQPLPVSRLLVLRPGLPHQLVHVLGDLPLLASGQQRLQPRPETEQSGDNTESDFSDCRDKMIRPGAVWVTAVLVQLHLTEDEIHTDHQVANHCLSGLFSFPQTEPVPVQNSHVSGNHIL